MNTKTMKYNYWTTTGRFLKKRGEFYLECECICGTKRFVRKCYLVKENSKSCGCMKRELISKAKFQHGHSGQKNGASRTYNSWRSMWVRCTDPQHPAYHNYGGRGITICDEWASFQNFLKDMGARPKNYELDRKDNNKNYQPDNCQWATRLTNQHNTRKSKIWIVEGRQYSSSREAAKAEGVTRATIVRWCTGYNPNAKSSVVPPKENCYSYPKYKEN